MSLNSIIKSVCADAYIEAADRGRAKSQIILADDKKNYFVKFQPNPQGPKTLVNELMANSIARFLGVPCPEGKLINIGQEFLDYNPALQRRFGAMPISPGWHFGVEELKDIYKNPPPATLARIHNVSAVPAILVFDILMCNTDRNSHDNYLIVKSRTSPERLSLYAIDHGHCLSGPNWIDTWLKGQVGAWEQNVINEMARLIHGVDPFRDALARLAQLSSAYVEGVISHIPNEWGLAMGERAAILEFIMEHKMHVGRLLEENRNLFPLWGARNG